MSKKMFFLFLAGGGGGGGGGGGKINWPGQLAPRGEDNQGGGQDIRDILPPGGQAVQGGKINCYTGVRQCVCVCVHTFKHEYL